MYNKSAEKREKERIQLIAKERVKLSFAVIK